MEFITRPIEQRLWPKGHRLAPAPPALVAARFAYALCATSRTAISA